MRLALSALLLPSLIALAACSTPKPAREVKIFSAGEKAFVDRLTYNVVDAEVEPHLGDEASPRTPEHRFYLVQVSVSNSGNTEATIPSLALVDDSGKQYPELTDGAGVQQWLGVVRKVGGGQTEQGYAAFDAPAGHYKLKLTDDTSDSDVYVDIPLNFVHEHTEGAAPAGAAESDAPSILKSAPAEKK
jgi:hypothetical protein